jgi:3-oxoacyl-[acyl-carrier-protein] synthase I
MAENESNIVIAGVGMATPVGLSTHDNYYTLRAGVAMFEEIDYLNRQREPYVMATIPDGCLEYDELVCDIKGIKHIEKRILNIAFTALEDLFAHFDSGSLPVETTLYLGWNPHFNRERIPQALVKQRFFPMRDKFHVISCGRGSGIGALNRACQALHRKECQVAIVGASDSYKNPFLLDQLDKAGRVKTYANLDGFLPGEGACFMIVTTEAMAQRKRWPVFAQVANTETGFEEGHLTSDAPYRGDGLAACVKQVLNGTQTEPVGQLYSSMNGEHYWSKEIGTSYIRNKKRFEVDFETIHPADRIGDTGAASGLIMTGMAAYSYREGHQHKPSLVYASSDTGERGAALIVPYR